MIIVGEATEEPAFLSSLVPLPAWRVEPRASEARILANRHLGDRYWIMTLDARLVADDAMPGQFAMLSIGSRGTHRSLLPRPMAVFNRDKSVGTIDIIYGIYGEGTRRLSEAVPGEVLTVVAPLGRGFSLPRKTTHLLLLGRGIGTCSLGLLATCATRAGMKVSAVLSSRSPGSDVLRPMFESMGLDRVMSVFDSDGTSDAGLLHGEVVQHMGSARPERIATCGSARLLRMSVVLAKEWRAKVEVSVEAHMACGVGYCHCCAVPVGPEREGPLVCRDGPVFGWSER